MWSDNPAVFLGLGLLLLLVLKAVLKLVLRLVLKPLLRLFLRHSFMLPLNHAEYITQVAVILRMYTAHVLRVSHFEGTRRGFQLFLIFLSAHVN